VSPRALLGLTFAAVVVTSSRGARASNVTEVPDNGSEQMGRGGAWLARASDPLATAFNPAGLAGQPTRVTIQNGFVVQQTCFTRLKAASDATVDLLADPATGRYPRVCNDVQPTLNPQIGGTWHVSDRLGLGVLVIGPASSGEKTFPELVDDGAGTRRPAPQRYLLTHQGGVIVFPTVGVGYEVVDALRLGVSFGWGFAKLKSSAATVALNSPGQTSDNDVQANLQVRDYFIPRVSVGGLWSASPNLDVAVWYQWADAIRAKGDVGTATSYYTPANARGDDSRVGYGDTIFSDCGTGRPQDAGKCGGGDNASVKLAQPMEAKLGLRWHQPRVAAGAPEHSRRRDPLSDDVYDVEVDLTWANDSAIDALEIRFPRDPSGAGRLPVSGISSQIPPNADQTRDYRDVLGVRLGGDLNLIPDRLAVRAGAYFESSAGRAELQQLDFAATQRFGVALGGTYRIHLHADRRDALEIMAGYGHTFFADSALTDRSARGIGALAGVPCGSNATLVTPDRCSDGTRSYRTSWAANLGTVTNALNVINVGVAYRF
jgi:long-chain fatty acid transport protein